MSGWWCVELRLWGYDCTIVRPDEDQDRDMEIERASKSCAGPRRGPLFEARGSRLEVRGSRLEVWRGLEGCGRQGFSRCGRTHPVQVSVCLRWWCGVVRLVLMDYVGVYTAST